MPMRTYKPAMQDGDRLPQAMVELATACDWEDMPGYLKDTLRSAADELRKWAAAAEDILVGEVVADTFAGRMAAQSIEAKKAKHP